VFKVSEVWRAAARHVAEEIWETESIPEEMLLAVMRNLRKARSGPEIFGDYRPACLLTSTYKNFSSMIYLSLLRETQGYISKWQADFRRKRGYVDNTLVLMTLLRHFKTLGLRIFATMTDIEKAFDSIDHTAIFDALIRAGASRKTVTLVRDIYAKAKVVILMRKAAGINLRSAEASWKGIFYPHSCSSWDSKRYFGKWERISVALCWATLASHNSGSQTTWRC
jgi:hypothetical protein